MHNMKQQLLQTVSKFTGKAILATFMLSTFLVTFLPSTGNAQAQYVALNNNPVIKYLGVLEDKLVFQINVDNVKEEKLLVTIKDEDGNILFTERVKDQKFSRKIAIEKEVFEGRKVTFLIQGAKDNPEQTFQVSRKARMVEDVVVTRQ
jgi:hypothetical protein